ncbi:hypothetical protein ACSBR1_036733 [Camellia fascicularis]
MADDGVEPRQRQIYMFIYTSQPSECYARVLFTHKIPNPGSTPRPSMALCPLNTCSILLNGVVSLDKPNTD